MTHRLINKKMPIYTFPNEFSQSLGSVTLGDLHGNAVKLLHFLFYHKLIRFKDTVSSPENTYQDFVFLYEQFGDLMQEFMENKTVLEQITAKDITNQDVARIVKKIPAAQLEEFIRQKLSVPKAKLARIVTEFHRLMDTLEVSDTKILARLIGDEVADRGSCDYFTLKIIEFFHLNKGKMNILSSNHGCEFIHAYEQLTKGQAFKPKGRTLDIQMTSFFGLKLLLENEIIPKEELMHLVEHSYKHKLKILDYTLEDKGIILYSHAPIRFDAIELLAREFRVPYNDLTKEALAETIDQINLKFQSFVESNMLSTLFDNYNGVDCTNMNFGDRCAWPVVYTTWNRWNESKETPGARPAYINDYEITYIHGHDPFESKFTHIHNLDTLSGKESKKNEVELINKAFEFILQNRNRAIDKSYQENYLRMVDRYKVLDSEESGSPQIKSRNDNTSMRALSGLGKPLLDQSLGKAALEDQNVLGCLLESPLVSDEVSVSTFTSVC